MSKIDLHIHSNYSDGSDTITELVKKIKNAGIEIFALTDHDTILGCAEMAKLLPKGIKFIPSIELTCKEEGVKCHILGYNCDCNNEKLLDLVLRGKELRRIKLETRIKYLKDVWSIELTQDELDWLYSRGSVVKTHIANILVKRGLANDNLSAMDKYLNGCKSGDTRFTVSEAIEAIISAGGIPVWAHPLGGEGEEHIAPEEFYSQYEILKNLGIQGLECYYSRYNQAEIEFLVNFAERNNLYITGGSDYHGINKDIPLGKLNVENSYVDSSKITILESLFI